MIPIITIDTNIVIKAFKGDESCKNILSNKISVVSVITEIELLSWPRLDFEGYNLLGSFLSESFIVNISHEIKESAISIRKNYGLKVPDAIIAATAIIKDIPLFSSDDIFKKIPHLNFVYVA
jgi:predicted nucleic acid-binding protein